MRVDRDFVVGSGGTTNAGDLILVEQGYEVGMGPSSIGPHEGATKPGSAKNVKLPNYGAGKNAFAGVRFTLPNGIAADVYAGYVFQNYGDDDPRLEEADGIGFGADLDWRPSDATRLRLHVLREIEEATTDLESGHVLAGSRLSPGMRD